MFRFRPSLPHFAQVAMCFSQPLHKSSTMALLLFSDNSAARFRVRNEGYFHYSQGRDDRWRGGSVLAEMFLVAGIRFVIGCVGLDLSFPFRFSHGSYLQFHLTFQLDSLAFFTVCSDRFYQIDIPAAFIFLVKHSAGGISLGPVGGGAVGLAVDLALAVHPPMVRLLNEVTAFSAGVALADAEEFVQNSDKLASLATALDTQKSNCSR